MAERFKIEKISKFETLEFCAYVEKVTDIETFTYFAQVIYGDIIPLHLHLDEDELLPELYEQYKKKCVRFDEVEDAVLFFNVYVLMRHIICNPSKKPKP